MVMPARSPWHVALGKAVREFRRRRHMTQVDLAARSKLQSTYISDVERGVRNPSWSVVIVLCEALDTSPAKLIALAEKLSSML